MPARFLTAALVLWTVGLGGLAPLALGQTGLDLANRPIADVRIDGLKQVDPQLVFNQVRSLKGDPYDPKVVADDIVRLTHLGRFSSVTVKVEQRPDGSVVLIFQVIEQPILSDVQVVGNKAIADQELLNLVVLRAGDPADPFLIEKGKTQIKKAYEKQGHYQTAVEIDGDLLKESGVLIFRIREGPLVRIQDIGFEGNKVFSSDELEGQVHSETYLFIVRKGELNRDELEQDSVCIRTYYQDHGYLDAAVSRQINPSPDGRDATVVFLISEGPQYTVGAIKFQGNQLFSDAQLLAAMNLKFGDVFSSDRLRKSQETMQDLYGKLGFLDVRVQIDRVRLPPEPKVELRVTVNEGQYALVGRYLVTGNQVTQDKVVYRSVRGMEPGRRFDRAGIADTERRLREGSLFSDAHVTLLGEPEDAFRDVLIEVKEKTTGSISFGAGISSDSGVIGSIELVQRNFDISDTPDSWGEMFSGRAFRGAGQTFAIQLQPGNTVNQYSVSFSDPAFLDTDYSFGSSLSLFSRQREKWDEQRAGGSLNVGHRFGDVWTAAAHFRAEFIDITSVFPGTAPTFADRAAVDVFSVSGPSIITSLGLGFSRRTTDSGLFPTRGSSISLNLDRVGAAGGDYEFTRVNVELRKYWTVDEDFIGRRSVLTLRMDVGDILENQKAPIFERFYAGGHRSLRGFDYRGIGPRGLVDPNGIPNSGDEFIGKDPVGGNFEFLLGLEYNAPIYADVLRGVVFIDSGTVQKTWGFNQYRASVGAGIRLKIPFLGQAPFALDFAIPILKQPGDEKRLFSFDLGLPF